MASHLLFLSLLLTAIAPSPPPQPPFSLLHPQPPSPPPSSSSHEAQFNTLIDALLAAGDFNSWANLLSSSLNPTLIPISATFFVPDDDAFLAALSRSPSTSPLINFLDPLLFPYHILPHRLPFSALRLLPTGARLPTLLPGFSLLVTNHSASNFTLSGARVTRPDLYQNGFIAVHGVGGFLDYALFGRDAPPPNYPLSGFSDGEFVGIGDRKRVPVSQVLKSGASNCCGAGFWIVSVVGLVALFWLSRNRD